MFKQIMAGTNNNKPNEDMYVSNEESWEHYCSCKILTTLLRRTEIHFKQKLIKSRKILLVPFKKFNFYICMTNLCYYGWW